MKLSWGPSAGRTPVQVVTLAVPWAFFLFLLFSFRTTMQYKINSYCVAQVGKICIIPKKPTLKSVLGLWNTLLCTMMESKPAPLKPEPELVAQRQRFP